MANYIEKPEYSGLFITLEGVDGCGKSTQAELIAEYLEDKGLRVVCLREPGGTIISEKIRTLLLDISNQEMHPDCELLLYEAARAQLTRQVIEPALQAGSIVLCDRYYDSTYAYQAIGRGINKSLVMKANHIGSCGYVPDATFVFDIDPKEAMKRACKRDELDRLELEGVEFQERVRKGYKDLAFMEKRVKLIDACGSVDEVYARVEAQLDKLLAGRFNG